MLTQEPDPNSPLGRFALRARRVPWWIRGPIIVVAFALVITAAVLDLPPYSLFADVQAAMFDGEHYPVLTVCLTILVFLLPAGLAIQLLAGLFPDNTPPDPFAYVPPPNAGPPPAYMQGGPYAQGLYGQGPQAPYGKAPPGQAPHGQGFTGQGPGPRG